MNNNIEVQYFKKQQKKEYQSEIDAILSNYTET